MYLLAIEPIYDCLPRMFWKEFGVTERVHLFKEFLEPFLTSSCERPWRVPLSDSGPFREAAVWGSGAD